MTVREYQQQQDDQEAGGYCLASLAAILDCWGVENVERLDRAIYKYTDCGPHLSVWLHDGGWKHSGQLQGVTNGNVRSLLVGSIVEGSDADVTGTVLDLLTFDSDEEAVAAFNAQVDKVNAEACALWEEANEEESEVEQS